MYYFTLAKRPMAPTYYAAAVRFPAAQGIDPSPVGAPVMDVPARGGCWGVLSAPAGMVASLNT